MQRENFINRKLNKGKYQILGIQEYFISNVAFDEVFKAKNTTTKEYVAIKRIITSKMKDEEERVYITREVVIMVNVIREEP